MPLHRQAKNSASFDAHRANADFAIFIQLLKAPAGRKYYTSTLESIESLDDSFLIESNGIVTAVVECDASTRSSLGRFGYPLEIQLNPVLPLKDRNKLLRDILSELGRIAQARDIRAMRIRTACNTDPDGLIAGHLLAEGARHQLEMRTVIDLSAAEGELLDDLRKGHRQQVRWGQKNMNVHVVDSTACNRTSFDQYRSLHAAVAGRVTRGDDSWDAMYDAICSGRGDLVLGYLGEQLVSGTLILDGIDTAYYSSGAYDRNHFDKPLAHWPLFQAVVRAKARGLRWFDVGEIGGSNDHLSEKERAICYFKRGFGSNTQSSLIWTRELPAQP